MHRIIREQFSRRKLVPCSIRTKTPSTWGTQRSPHLRWHWLPPFRARPRCKTNPIPYVCSLSYRFEADAPHSWFPEAPGGVASPRRISSLPMRCYGTKIFADPLMEMNDDDRTLVDFDIPGVEDIKRVKPSLRFAPAMEPFPAMYRRVAAISTLSSMVF